jgi:hypothetical protein
MRMACCQLVFCLLMLSLELGKQSLLFFIQLQLFQ